MFTAIRHPRFLLAAALIALILCLLPARVDAPEDAPGPQASPVPQILEADRPATLTAQTSQASQASQTSQTSPSAQPAQTPSSARPQATEASGIPAGADLSERTQSGCRLHRTLYYAPCGHSVQRREALPAQLVGLSRQALEAEIADALPGAMITGFSAAEVDASFSLSIPCPLHWVLDRGEGGTLCVLQNRDGETLAPVRETDVPLDRLSQEQLAELPWIFDDVQALEGVLESLGS